MSMLLHRSFLKYNVSSFLRYSGYIVCSEWGERWSTLTFVWSQHTGLCWGILSCKFWSLPAHHCIAADAAPAHAPWHLTDTTISDYPIVWYSGEELLCLEFSSYWISLPGVLVSFGMMHRTKWGWVLLRLAISLFKFSCEIMKWSLYY